LYTTTSERFKLILQIIYKLYTNYTNYINYINYNKVRLLCKKSYDNLMDISGQLLQNEKSSYTNNVTLDYLTNPSYTTDLAKKRPENMIVNKVEVKFYRKRVLGLTREMLKGVIPSKNLKRIHDNYVSSIIEYFKMTDTRDILQDEYGYISELKDDQNIILKEAINLEKANEIMMNKPTIISTLDNFVNTKIIKIEETIPPPKKKQINLQTAALKIKGLKKKKKP